MIGASINEPSCFPFLKGWMGRPAGSRWRAYHLVLKGQAFGIVLLEPGFRMTRNSAKNHTQPELAIPVGDPSGRARRVSSGTVVRRAAWLTSAGTSCAVTPSPQ
jgi:hypothetical protein